MPSFAPGLSPVEPEVSAEFVTDAAAVDAVVGDSVIALVTITVEPPATVVGEACKDGDGVIVTVAAAVVWFASAVLSTRNREL